jgi:hypothetical protein
MSASGLELVRDAAHFARIGARYWGGTFYANTALPSLAPAFPMIVVDREGRAQLQARSSYMMRLLAADGFRLAERWLLEAPPAPSGVAHAVRGACAPDLLAANPEVGVGAAVRACERLRGAGTVPDEAWVLGMQALFDGASAARITAPAPIATRAAILEERRTNARPWAGAETIAA